MDQAISPVTVKKTGFVCPPEMVPHWKQSECTIEPCTDGDFVVLDHSIQAMVFIGTQAECKSFLGPVKSAPCPTHGPIWSQNGCTTCAYDC